MYHAISVFFTVQPACEVYAKDPGTCKSRKSVIMRKALKKFKNNKFVLVEYDFSTDTRATFQAVDTTDHYRKGKPYKLFTAPGASKVTIPFALNRDVPHGYRYDDMESIDIVLNHCRTTSNAIVDVGINGTEILSAYSQAPNGNFGEQTFNYPIHNFQRGENNLEIKLNSGSPAVYWLSDVKFILHIDFRKLK